ncbi:hypothetical protein MT418_006373 [Batrachochytrium dendrobatidis]
MLSHMHVIFDFKSVISRVMHGWELHSNVIPINTAFTANTRTVRQKMIAKCSFLRHFTFFVILCLSSQFSVQDINSTISSLNYSLYLSLTTVSSHFQNAVGKLHSSRRFILKACYAV